MASSSITSSFRTAAHDVSSTQMSIRVKIPVLPPELCLNIISYLTPQERNGLSTVASASITHQTTDTSNIVQLFQNMHIASNLAQTDIDMHCRLNKLPKNLRGEFDALYNELLNTNLGDSQDLFFKCENIKDVPLHGVERVHALMSRIVQLKPDDIQGNLRTLLTRLETAVVSSLADLDQLYRDNTFFKICCISARAKRCRCSSIHEYLTKECDTIFLQKLVTTPLENFSTFDMSHLWNIAAQVGHIEVIKYLLAHRNVMPEQCLYVALNTAVKNGQAALVNLLIQEGAFIISHWGRNEAIIQAMENGHLKVVKLLASCCQGDKTLSQAIMADCLIPTVYHSGALKRAAVNGHLESVQWALENGFVLLQVDREEAIIGAAQKGCLEMVKFLLSDGVSKQHLMDVKDTLLRNKQSQAVKQAAVNGHLEFVQWALENGFEFLQVDREEAVVDAIETGSLEVIKFLLSDSAHISTQHLMKAIDKAKRYEDVDIEKYLKDYNISLSSAPA